MDQRLLEDLKDHYRLCDEGGCRFQCRFQFKKPTLEELQGYVGMWAQEKGWNETPRTQGDWHALFHTEISESFEEHRKGMAPTHVYHGNAHDSNAFKPEGMAVELADCVIRIMHWFDYHNMDLDEVLGMKFRFNETRSHRHGNKVV